MTQEKVKKESPYLRESDCEASRKTKIDFLRQKINHINFATQHKARLYEPLGNTNTYILRPLESSAISPIIWLVSPGCSGTSFLYKNIPSSENYAIMKSHSYPLIWNTKSCIKSSTMGGYMWNFEHKDRILYIYSHPLNILLGFHKKVNDSYNTWKYGDPHYVDWLECDTEIDFNENYLNKDILNLEKHLDKWWRPQGVSCLCIKYEKMFEHQTLIGHFLGLDSDEEFNLGEQKPRKTDWRLSPHKDQLLKTYSSVIEKFEEKPDYQIFKGLYT